LDLCSSLFPVWIHFLASLPLPAAALDYDSQCIAPLYDDSAGIRMTAKARFVKLAMVILALSVSQAEAGVCPESADFRFYVEMIELKKSEPSRDLSRHRERAVRYNNQLKDLILSRQDQFARQMCRLTFEANTLGTDSIDLQAAPKDDPQCSSETRVSYSAEGPQWGPVGAHRMVRESYTGLRELVACQNAFASAIGLPAEPMPTYELRLQELRSDGRPDGMFYFTPLNPSAPKFSCTGGDFFRMSSETSNPPLPIKVSPGLACLLRRHGYWKGGVEFPDPALSDSFIRGRYRIENAPSERRFHPSHIIKTNIGPMVR
jgi:hypothetical protein